VRTEDMSKNGGRGEGWIFRNPADCCWGGSKDNSWRAKSRGETYQMGGDKAGENSPRDELKRRCYGMRRRAGHGGGGKHDSFSGI